MVSRVQNIRSTTKNTRPPNSTRQPGEFFVNFADKQFGVIDTAQVPQDLIAIRFHSSLTDYAIGDHVIYQGKAYRAKQVIPAGNFNPAFWETAGMADAPADNKLYGRVNNTWDLVEIGDVLALQGALDAKAPLASPAFSGTPTAATAAAATNSSQLATTAFVKGQNYAAIGGPELLARVAKVGDTMTGPLTLPSDPTVPLHAATKQYVDNKPSGASTIDTPPSSAVNGQLWWETDTGGLFVRYDDGSSQQWVQLNGEMGNAVQKTGDTMSGQLTVGANLIVTGGIIANYGVNAAMELGTPGTASTPVVDFHSGAFSTDYDVRIVASGGTAAAGQGTLVFNASNVIVPSTLASTSPTTGALTVAGGAGIGGVIHCGGLYTEGVGAVVTGNGAAAASVYFTTPANGKSLNYDGTRFNLNGGGLNLPYAAPLSTTYTTAALNIGFGSQFGIALRPLNNDQFPIVFTNAADANVGYIQCSAAATNYATSSDGRLKEDLKTFDAGNVIDDTNVYDFAWKSTGERAYGVIAQEANEVYPLAVGYMEEQDAWGVDYSKYVPVILQELKALRARVAELEGEKAPIAPKKRS
jgi:hypothetical protein